MPEFNLNFPSNGSYSVQTKIAICLKYLWIGYIFRTQHTICQSPVCVPTQKLRQRSNLQLSQSTPVIEVFAPKIVCQHGLFLLRIENKINNDGGGWTWTRP